MLLGAVELPSAQADHGDCTGMPTITRPPTTDVSSADITLIQAYSIHITHLITGVLSLILIVPLARMAPPTANINIDASNPIEGSPNCRPWCLDHRPWLAKDQEQILQYIGRQHQFFTPYAVILTSQEQSDSAGLQSSSARVQNHARMNVVSKLASLPRNNTGSHANARTPSMTTHMSRPYKDADLVRFITSKSLGCKLLWTHCEGRD